PAIAGETGRACARVRRDDSEAIDLANPVVSRITNKDISKRVADDSDRVVQLRTSRWSTVAVEAGHPSPSKSGKVTRKIYSADTLVIWLKRHVVSHIDVDSSADADPDDLIKLTGLGDTSVAAVKFIPIAGD